MAKAVVELHIDGAIYGAWQDVSIRLGIDSLANDFQVKVSNRWEAGRVQFAGPPIRRGQECRLTIDGETVITGRVMRCAPSYDANSWNLAVTGRDRAEALVRCSVEPSPVEYRNSLASEIVAALAKPYGISVSLAADQGLPLDLFALQPGEKVFAAIDRLCRLRALLPYSDGIGGLILGQAGTARHDVVLQDGVNILAADGEYSFEDRHSLVRVMGQTPGFDGNPGEGQGIGLASDAGVSYYAPLTVLAELTGDDNAFQQRAAWEVNTRTGRSDQVSVTLMGWRDAGFTGRLWRQNNLVRLHSPALGLDTDMLITSLALTQNDNDGTRARLQLSPPAAYLPEPAKPQQGAW